VLDTRGGIDNRDQAKIPGKELYTERTVVRVVPYRQPIVTRVIPPGRHDVETAAGLHLVRAGI
jgi:hypothetical protein